MRKRGTLKRRRSAIRLTTIIARVATITFDDAVTGVPVLIAATTNAGYPATVGE